MTAPRIVISILGWLAAVLLLSCGSAIGLWAVVQSRPRLLIGAIVLLAGAFVAAGSANIMARRLRPDRPRSTAQHGWIAAGVLGVLLIASVVVALQVVLPTLTG